MNVGMDLVFFLLVGGMFLCWGWLCRLFWHLVLILGASVQGGMLVCLRGYCCGFVCVGPAHLFFYGKEREQVCEKYTCANFLVCASFLCV